MGLVAHVGDQYQSGGVGGAGVSVPSPCLTQVGGSGRLLQRPFASAHSQPTGVLAQQLALLCHSNHFNSVCKSIPVTSNGI